MSSDPEQLPDAPPTHPNQPPNQGQSHAQQVGSILLTRNPVEYRSPYTPNPPVSYPTTHSQGAAVPASHAQYQYQSQYQQPSLQNNVQPRPLSRGSELQPLYPSQGAGVPAFAQYQSQYQQPSLQGNVQPRPLSRGAEVPVSYAEHQFQYQSQYQQPSLQGSNVQPQPLYPTQQSNKRPRSQTPRSQKSRSQTPRSQKSRSLTPRPQTPRPQTPNNEGPKENYFASPNQAKPYRSPYDSATSQPTSAPLHASAASPSQYNVFSQYGAPINASATSPSQYNVFSQYGAPVNASATSRPQDNGFSQYGAPANASATSPSQYNGFSQYGWQQGEAPTGIPVSPNEPGVYAPAVGSFSPGLNIFNSGRTEDRGLDNMIEGVLKDQFSAEVVKSQMTYDAEAEVDEAGESENDEDEDAYQNVEPGGSGNESDFLEGSDSSSSHDGEFSDTDTVHREHAEKMMGLRKEIYKVRAMHKDSASKQKYKRLATASLRKGGAKGPRKIAELTGDIQMRLGQANAYFFQKKYTEARKEAQLIIKINAEIWQAYNVLALVHKEWGQFDEELLALTTCCHFKPKEESGMLWLEIARRIDEADDELRQKHLADGEYCSRQALKDVKLRKNVEALYLHAGFNREMNKVKSAIKDYEVALREDPHNPKAMLGLAECYLDQEQPELAKKIYEDAITFYQQRDLPENQFGFTEVSQYTVLRASIGEYAEAAKCLKMLSRWILGRGEEIYWDEITEDDREWDTDDLRRIDVPSYVPHKYDLLSYGDGLPLELRIRLGTYRLKLGNFEEAMFHFSFLENEAQFSDKDDLVSISDLLQLVGDELYKCGHYDDALAFYRILTRIPDEEYSAHYLQMGKCCLELENLQQEAENAFLTTLHYNEDSIEVRQELAKLYDGFDKEKAAEYRQEIKAMVKKSSVKYQLAGLQPEKAAKVFIARKERKPTNRRKGMEINPNAAYERQLEDERLADLHRSYETVQRCHSGLIAGDAEATSEWMAAAAELVADFRTCKGLYPYDKFYYAPAYESSKSQDETEKALRDENRKAAPNEDPGPSNNPSHGKPQKPAYQKKRPEMPTEHLGVPWANWLDLLVQYAICLAKDHRHLEAYMVCISAKEAVVFCHEQESMFTIYLCWCTCAVLANDMDTITSQIRHFMKEYQFTTDAYRLFAAMVRMCQSPLSHLTKGPTTKFILRNIKTMDFSLVKHTLKEGNTEFRGMASYTARDANGKPVVNTEMDICLLLLYGHILYVNTSFGKALHYLFRAYSLDPGNIMINMSIGLCYIQYAIKRQTKHRPYVITQGFSFLQKYYAARSTSSSLEEREEAHYNMARLYHMLGLNHLAIPYYIKVLREAGDGVGGGDGVVVEAAYNLRTLYAVAGNNEMAKAVTERWLCI